jgi:hypothetical protein
MKGDLSLKVFYGCTTYSTNSSKSYPKDWWSKDKGQNDKQWSTNCYTENLKVGKHEPR